MKHTIAKYLQNLINRKFHLISTIIYLVPGIIGLILIALNRNGLIPGKQLDLGIVSFNFYGLTAAFGIFIACGMIYLHLKRNALLQPIFIKFDVFLPVVVISGVVGARLFHVISEWEKIYKYNPLSSLAIWQGGLSIFGAVVLGLVALLILLKHYNLLTLTPELLRIVVTWVPLGQAFGRLGNYFNQELFGYPVDSILGIYVAPQFRDFQHVNFSYFHPIFWYEQLGLIILGLIFIWLDWAMVNKLTKSLHVNLVRNLWVFYFIGYGIIRLIIEAGRLDPKWFLNFSFGQFLALIAISFGLIVLGLDLFKFTIRSKQND